MDGENVRYDPSQHTELRRRELSLVQGQSASAGKASPGERCKLLCSSGSEAEPSRQRMFRNLQTISVLHFG